MALEIRHPEIMLQLCHFQGIGGQFVDVVPRDRRSGGRMPEELLKCLEGPAVAQEPGSTLRAYPKTSSFGPRRRSHSFSILEIVPLFLRLKKSCGLAWNQNLRFSDRL